jgi:hypothetical protein
LELARRKGLVEVSVREELKGGLDEIGAMLSGLMKLKANQP